MVDSRAQDLPSFTGLWYPRPLAPGTHQLLDANPRHLRSATYIGVFKAKNIAFD